MAGSLLDLGCGRGELTRRLVALDRFSVYGMDREMDPGIPGVTYRQVDLEHGSIDGTFDIVVCTELIEHLRNPFGFLARACAAVAPDGCLILSTPNVAGAASRLWFLLHGRLLNFSPTDLEESGHINPLALWQIEVVLGESGLEIDVARTTPYAPVVRSFRDRLFLIACRVIELGLRPRQPGNILVVRAWKRSRPAAGSPPEPRSAQ
jgi:SAM-dependent methyltransferase